MLQNPQPAYGVDTLCATGIQHYDTLRKSALNVEHIFLFLVELAGGTGFLGSHLVTKLVQDGHHVRILARNPPRNAADLPPQVEFIQGSVTDPHAVLRATDGAAGIFHLSGVVEHSRRNDDAITATHVDGTRNVLEAAERSRARVVYASTSGTVAVSTDPMSRPGDDAPYAEAVTAPWPYYRSKIEAERAARRLAEEKGVELVRTTRAPFLTYESF